MLERLRRRGQRPAGGVFVTDDYRQRANLEESGLFALSLPGPETVELLVGLEVALIADPTSHATEIAQQIVAARPGRFNTFWRGRGWEPVL